MLFSACGQIVTVTRLGDVQHRRMSTTRLRALRCALNVSHPARPRRRPRRHAALARSRAGP